jgi:acetamidase/formamidase
VFDGAIKNDDSADDVRNAPLPGVHVLSGPFHVEGAEPGDLLIVDILEIDAVDEDDGPLSGMGWGYTGVFAKSNGGGFLTTGSRTPTRSSGTSGATSPLHATSRSAPTSASTTPA